MTPDEILLLHALWWAYRKARRQNKGRWLSASREAASNARIALRILRDARERWQNEYA